MTTIDDALIAIFPDFSQFNARLREGLRAAEERIGAVKIQTRVDASETARNISEAIRRADKVVTLTTRLDDRDFKAKLAALEHGDDAKITLRAQLEAAKARLELAKLGSDINVTVKAEAEVANAKKALEDLARNTGQKTLEDARVAAAKDGAAARKKIADDEEAEARRRSGRGLAFFGSAGFANLIQGPAVVGLIAAITPVTGAVLGLASAFAVAGGASATFGVAAVGHIAQITTVMKQMEQQGQQLSELPAPFQKLIPVITATQNSWNLFLQNTRGPVFDDFIAGMGVAQGALSKFTPVVNAIAVGIKGALSTVGDFANGPAVQSFLNLMQSSGPAAIQSLTRSAANLSTGLLDIVTGFMPAGTSMLNLIEGLTVRFEKWADSLKGSPDFQNFLDYSAKYGPRVLDILVNLGVTVGKIVIGLAPFGAAVVGILQGLSKFLSVFSPGAWTAIAAGLGLLYLNMQRLVIISALSSAWATFQALINGTTLTRVVLELRATSEAMAATSISARGLAGGLGVALVALYGIGEAADKLSTIGAKAVPGINQMTSDLTGLTSANQIAAKSLKGDWNDIDKDPNAFADALDRITNANTGQRFTDFLHDMHLGSSNLAKDKDLFTGIDSALAQMVSSGHADQAAASFKKLTEGLSPKQIEQLKTLLPQYSDAQVGATNSTNAFGDALQNVTPLLDAYNKAIAGSDIHQVSVAELATYNTLQQSIRALTDARYQEGQVAQQTAQADVQAARQVKDAQHSYAEAQLSSKNATEALTKARQDATRALEDQGNKEHAAFIANERAKAAAFSIGAYAGPVTPEYQLRQLEIQDQLTSTTTDLNRTLADGNKLRANGVDNAPGVVSAQKAVNDADYAEQKAKQAVADAIKNQTTTLENGRHARDQAKQATVDATVAEINAQAAYDNSTTALTSTGDAAKITTGNMQGLRSELSRALILDASNPLQQLQDIANYMSAIKLLATDPTMTFQQAWSEATGPQLPTVGGVKGPWAAGYTGSNTYSSGSLGAIGQRSIGGSLSGPGHDTSDNIPILASPGEYVVRAAAARKLGTPYLDFLNHADKYATGGLIDSAKFANTNITAGLSALGYTAASGGAAPTTALVSSNSAIAATQTWLQSIKDNLPYVFGAVGPNSFDCSGLVGEVWARLTGNKSNTRYFVTGDEGAFLEKHGFQKGTGTFTVGFNDHHTVGNISGMEFEAAHTGTKMRVGNGTNPTSMPNVYYLPTLGNAFINSGGGAATGTIVKLPAELGFPGGSYYAPGGSGTTATTTTGGDVGDLSGLVGASMYGGPTDPSSGTHGYHGDSLVGKMAYAELSKNPKALDFAALGGLPYGQNAHISYNNRTIDAKKLDVGGGGGDVNGHHRSVDLWYELASKLGFAGTGLVDFKTFAGGGPVRNNGMVVADRGAVLPPMSRTIVENRTSQNENVGFGTRLDEFTLNRLAQILGAMQFKNYLDGKELKDHINENLGRNTGTAGLK